MCVVSFTRQIFIEHLLHSQPQVDTQVTVPKGEPDQFNCCTHRRRGMTGVGGGGVGLLRGQNH